MESTMVIKVKYGEMLRRFSVRVLENNKLDVDINGLRAKVLNLFNLSSDTDVTLTYIDEDGDIVALVNDDDLHDVMRQQLKFLRIDVQLKNEKNDQSRDRSDGSSTLPMSAHGQHSFQNVRPGISEVLKSLPEPLPEFCSQFLLDIASKAAVASPVLAELAQSFIRLGNTHPNSDSPSPSVPGMSPQNVATESSKAPLGAESKASKDVSYKEDKVINSERVTKNIGVAEPTSVDLNGFPYVSIASGISIGKSANAAPCSSSFGGKTKEKICPNVDLCNEAHLAQRRSNAHYSPAPCMNGSLLNECPFSGVPLATGSSMLGTEGKVPISGSSRYNESVGSTFHKGQEISSGYCETVGSMFPKGHVSNSSACIEPMGSMFHRGVICDGCGARPITGPRFKSQVKDNYDLCIICFAEMGNETDYIRIDRPITCRHPRMKAFSRRHALAGTRIIDTLKNSGKQTKLDSRFVVDVNVLDGTVMAPSTTFTKIWRMRNSGSLNWPRGTQLVLTEGDKFSHLASVDIEVPADGLPVGQEIDIAVDFTAPTFSGHYTSYWRLVSPSGQKFGQRVWVLIEVDAALGRLDSHNSQALDLNLAPIVTGNGGSNGHEDVEQNSTPVISDGVPFPPRDSCPIAEQAKPDHNLPGSETEQRFLINDDLLVGKSPATSAKEDNLVSYPAIDCHGVLSCSTKVPSVSYPLIDFSEPIPAANSPPPVPSPKVSPASSEKVTTNNIIEETLLKTLEDMGFKQVNLNKEVLKRTGYDLEKSVDELCGVAEWDPMLEELEEMGFGDKEMNRMLLMKNNGSMKRVVMELICGDKA